MIGITLMEDLAVICMTVVLPVFGGSGDGGLRRPLGLLVRLCSFWFRWFFWRSR